MRRKTIWNRLRLSVLNDPQKERIFEKMKGHSDKDTEHGGLKNQFWASVCGEELLATHGLRTRNVVPLPKPEQDVTVWRRIKRVLK